MACSVQTLLAVLSCGAMTNEHDYSLWLTPRDAVSASLGELICGLSEIYKTPPFLPHVTLLASVSRPQAEVIARTLELALACGPFEIELGEPAFTDDYFRSLFIKVTPNPALLSAHRRARELFNMPQEPYLPHLSVLYGNLPAAEKKTIIARLNRDYPRRFTAEAIDVYLSEGKPEDWRLVESVALTA